MRPQLIRGSIAEFVGTFFLCFLGCGSVIAAGPDAGVTGLVVSALGHGCTLVVFVTVLVRVSGAQFNPAVSIGLVVAGEQDAKTAGVYIAFQMLGAACGCGMLVALLGREGTDPVQLGATVGSLTREGDVVGVLGFEVVCTFALMFIILAALRTGQRDRLMGVAVGTVVSACILAAGPYSGAGLNPARSFGPQLYGYWEMAWAYTVGPIVGACAAVGLARAMPPGWVEREGV